MKKIFFILLLILTPFFSLSQSLVRDVEVDNGWRIITYTENPKYSFYYYLELVIEEPAVQKSYREYNLNTKTLTERKIYKSNIYLLSNTKDYNNNLVPTILEGVTFYVDNEFAGYVDYLLLTTDGNNLKPVYQIKIPHPGAIIKFEWELYKIY